MELPVCYRIFTSGQDRFLGEKRYLILMVHDTMRRACVCCTLYPVCRVGPMSVPERAVPEPTLCGTNAYSE